MRRRCVVASVACMAAISLLSGCADDRRPSAGQSSHKLRIATTVAPITSIVASVAGDLAEVTGLVPEGTNSHTFEPPPSAAAVLARADVIFVNGLGLEEPTRELAGDNARPGVEIVELGNLTIAPDEYVYDFSFPRSGGRPNPHLWTSPPLARQYARVVADTLMRRDPPNADAYEANFERFAATADALDQTMVAATATLPPERRRLLTYHDAFAYFARHYGWTVVGAIQPSSFEEPTAREVGALIRQVREQKVPAIFGSEVFPSPVLEQIGKETGAAYLDVLRDDDLPGQRGDPEHSWAGLMRFDFATMVDALGGDAGALERLPIAEPSDDHATYPR